jgi:ATPase subunit of ABC transporter with duplicated ATPase domains
VQAAAEKPVSALSGGERIRAGLAALLAADQAPELLLLDEPSNHLDLPGLEAVAAALRAYRGALLLVTHDEAFARDVEVERELTLPPRERANRGVEACVARSGLSGSGSSAPPSIYFYECGERVLSFS